MATERIALVTGGNRGIGFETARQLAAAGMLVLLSSRTIEEANAAAAKLESDFKLSVSPLKLDISEAKDRVAVAQYISERFQRLDILVNNAGVTAPTGTLMDPIVSQVSEEELRQVFEMNLFSTILTTQVLLPLLKKSIAGRIVNVSSQLGSLTLQSSEDKRVAYNKRFAYNASKAALNMFTILLSQELRDTPIKVNSVHPGWVKTRAGTDMAPMDPSEGAKTSVEAAVLPAEGPSGTFLFQNQQLPW